MRAATALASLLPLSQQWRADAPATHDNVVSCIASGFAALDRELPGGGWPQGQLIELLLDAPGCGELSLLMPALAQVTRAQSSVWVLPCESVAGAQPFLPYAPALTQAGIDLARNVFVWPATPRESAWAFEQALRATHLGAVIGWLAAGGSAESDFRVLRRLHLLATRQRVLVFVLRETCAARAPSPAALRLQLAQCDGAIEVTVLKRRGRPLLEPVALQVHPARWNTSRVETAAAAARPARPALSKALQAIFNH